MPDYQMKKTWDITRTIKDYEYTLRSAANLKRIVNCERFMEDDSETILRYLTEQMEIVSFGDFLKRYIYEITKNEEPFSEITEEYYLSYISESFGMNRAPHAFTPVRSKWRTTVKRWLTSQSVERNTVFLLGFGLNMTDQDVSMFLTKVIKEQDFNFFDPAETVYWHCFHYGLPYAEACELLSAEETEILEEPDPSLFTKTENALRVYLSNRQMLKAYLNYLKSTEKDPGKTLKETFRRLYERAAKAARILRQSETSLETVTSGAYDIESVLYSGIKRNSDHNLAPASKSILRKIINTRRLDRQHTSQLINQQVTPQRGDILTLLFLIHAASDHTADRRADSRKRVCAFIDEANDTLKSLHMWEIYPVNPYESFLLLCLMTEDPVCAFNDVWEESYDE